MILKHSLSMLLVLLVLAWLQPVHAQALSDGFELDHIVAVVNDNLVTRNELDREIDTIMQRIIKAGQTPPPREAIETQVLDKLIDKRLQLDKARSLGIDVTPDMLATMIGNIAKNNGLSIGELRQTLQAEGQSFKTFRRQIEEQILLTRLKNQEIINKINVSDAEIDSLIQQDRQLGKRDVEYRLQHILIGLPEAASPSQIAQARQKAQDIISQLEQGADFSRLAMLHSSGQNALEGGELGWLKSNRLPSIFADVVVGMEPSQISEPIRSPSGFHIIRLADIKGQQASYISQTRARHILINTNEMVSDDDARIRLEQLHFRIENGEDFEKLARSHSDDKGSAIKGGDLGWLGPGSVVKEFQDVMDELAPGEVSQPFRTGFGWHIVQVLERRQHDNSDEILRSEARKIIVNRKAEDATDLFMRRLRDEAYIEIRLEES